MEYKPSRATLWLTGQSGCDESEHLNFSICALYAASDILVSCRTGMLNMLYHHNNSVANNRLLRLKTNIMTSPVGETNVNKTSDVFHGVAWNVSDTSYVIDVLLVFRSVTSRITMTWGGRRPVVLNLYLQLDVTLLHQISGGGLRCFIKKKEKRRFSKSALNRSPCCNLATAK